LGILCRKGKMPRQAARQGGMEGKDIDTYVQRTWTGDVCKEMSKAIGDRGKQEGNWGTKAEKEGLHKARQRDQ